MKIVFIICNDAYTDRVMELLSSCGIDYYTRWEQVTGKGHGTEPHLGTRSFPGMNSVLMIAIEDESPLAGLKHCIQGANEKIARAGDRIRMFQVPLESVI